MKSLLSLLIVALICVSIDGKSQNVLLSASSDPCEVTDFPFTEGFEASGVPDCWTSLYVFEEDRPAPSVATAHSGNQSWRFSSFNKQNSLGQNQYLISPPLAASAAPKVLSFFYNTLTYPLELFSVGYSTTNNDPYSFIWTDSIDYAVTYGWMEYSRTFPANTKYLAIYYRSLYKFYVYIDDITIDIQKEKDVAVTEIISPQSGNLTGTEPVSVKITNMGTQSVQNFPVKFETDGTLRGNETFSGTLNPQASATFTFQNATANLQQLKSYNIKAYTDLNNDQFRSNDTISKKVSNFGNCIFIVPFTEKFEDESDLACWEIRYNNPACKPGLGLISRSGNKSWAFSSKNGESDQLLITPELAATSRDLSLRFYYNNPHSSEVTAVFQVGYSTTNKETGSFHWTQAASVNYSRNGWVEYNGTVPAGAKYIAIHYFCTNQQKFFIDDMTVREIADTDVELSAIVSPVSGNDLSNAETVTVKVKNVGKQAVSNVPVSYSINGATPVSQTFTGNINPSQEASYTFDTKANLSMSQTSYTIKAYTELTGDLLHDNDTLSVQVTNARSCKITSFPYEQDFESPVSNCWTTYNYDGDFYEWDRTYTTNAHSGNYAMYHGGGTVQENGWLVSPKIAVPAGSVLALYFWSYNTFSSGDFDKNSVWVSETGMNQADFREIWSVSNVSAAEWEETALSLAEFAGKEIYIAFRYQARPMKHGWYIDDVTIKDITDIKDAGVTAILSPVLNAGNMGEETVKVRVRNFGGQTLTNLPVKFTVDGQQTVQGTVASIAPLKDAEYTFTNGKANLSVAGIHKIKAYTILPEDMNTANDTALINIRNYGSCEVSSFPYKESFESEPDRFICWTTYDADGWYYGEWKPTTTLEGRTIHAHDGLQVAIHEPYDKFQDGWLISPKINLPAEGVHELSFWNYTAYPGDYGTDAESSVWISTTNNDPASGSFEKVWEIENQTNAWQEGKVNLYGYAGQTIYIAFRYKGTWAHAWILDDVKIERISGADVGITQLVSPTSADAGKKNVQVKVTVKNFGAESVSSIPVKYQIKGKAVVEETFTTNLLPGETAEYIFTQTVDLSAYGKYVIRAWTALNNDTDADNDSFESETIAWLENIKLYGYQIYDRNDILGAVSFYSEDPSTLSPVSSYSDNETMLVAGEYVDGKIYAYSENNNFIRLTKEWEELGKTPITTTPSDMTYDYSTKTMYAIVGAGSYSDLNTVDMTTGAMTYVGSTDRFIYTLAADLSGNLYGLDYNGILHNIDKESGINTPIGSTEFELISAMQSMTFDHNTGRLFWAGIVLQGSQLIEIEPENGSAEAYGAIGITGEIVCLYTIYPKAVSFQSPVTQSIEIYPNPSSGVVRFSQPLNNASIRIVDISGRTVYTADKQNGDAKLELNLTAGIYSVIIENAGGKTVRKLVIR
ncbi:MAG: choice-of-anchor J domain-containing protein [Dysgonamonadaceae bacterium]|jgi:hypothetical protein|nr:choice-of-anchor J domain-containing protein [Dysgonamonadaceae bacterium]